MFETGETDAPSAAARNRRYFDQRQQAAMMFVALFVGGVIGPLLIAFDTDRPWRGIFLCSAAVVMFLFGLAAWMKLPRDQRTWKSLRSPR